MIFTPGHYYEIERNGKIEIVQFKKIASSLLRFNFLDGENESIDITYDMIDGGIFKIRYLTELNTIMA